MCSTGANRETEQLAAASWTREVHLAVTEAASETFFWSLSSRVRCRVGFVPGGVGVGDTSPVGALRAVGAWWGGVGRRRPRPPRVGAPGFVGKGAGAGRLRCCQLCWLSARAWSPESGAGRRRRGLVVGRRFRVGPIGGPAIRAGSSDLGGPCRAGRVRLSPVGGRRRVGGRSSELRVGLGVRRPGGPPCSPPPGRCRRRWLRVAAGPVGRLGCRGRRLDVRFRSVGRGRPGRRRCGPGGPGRQ